MTIYDDTLLTEKAQPAKPTICWLRVFVWFIAIPTISFSFYYGLGKLVFWVVA